MNAQTLVAKTRIGISTGQIVRTSYGTGGVIVDIIGPYAGDPAGPVYTIVYVQPQAGQRYHHNDCCWINEVHRDDRGIYHCGGGGDTLTVEDNPNPPPQALNLLELLEENAV